MPDFPGGPGIEFGLPQPDIMMTPDDSQANFGVGIARNRMADDPEPPPAPTPEKEKPTKDENDVPVELWPYRDELMKWVDEHNLRSQLLGFLQYTNDNTRFDLVAGMGFYHAPEERKISLSVPDFKKMKESLGMTVGQFVFGSMHEIAHLKTMAELDDAGLENELEQFNYEKQKKYFARDPNGKPIAMNAQGAYRQYYNICEDAIVNYLVFQTGLYGKDVTAFSRQNNGEVVSLYTDTFFPVYLPAGDGQGDYVMVPNEKGQLQVKPVGPGQGNVRIANAEDYQRGFDWNKTADSKNRSSQLLTFFMKNQMTGLPVSRIATSENQPDAHILHEDVAMVYQESLSTAYRQLLEKIIAKAKANPAIYASTLDLLSRPAFVDLYQDDGREVVKVEGATKAYFNVVPRGDGMPINNALTTININMAVQLFERNIGKCLEQMSKKSGYVANREVTYLEIFNFFKEIDKASNYHGTKPLKHNLVNRTHVMRTLLEPIYTMLCILDESFETEVPEKPPTPPKEPKDENDSEKQNKPENKKPITWEVGDKVRNKKTGKKGILRNVYKDKNGKVDSVEVEYYEEEPVKNSMANYAGDTREVVGGDTEVITRPIKETLIVVQDGDADESQSGKMDDDYDVEIDDKPKKSKSGKSDKKDKKDKPEKGEKDKSDGDEGEEDKPDGDDGDDGDQDKPDGDEGKEKSDKPDQGDEGDEDEDGDGDKNSSQSKPGKGGGGKERERTGKELEGVISDEEKALKRMIADRNRKRNTKNAENDRKTNEYQNKVAKKDRKKRLKAKAQRKEAEDKDKTWDPDGQDQTESDSDEGKPPKKDLEEMAELFINIEEQLHDPIEKMSKAWLEILENISTKIEIVVDKYYRNGKVDAKKLQRLLPEIELGADIDRRLVYSRIVEKIKSELRPKMIRSLLVVDDSGSMEGEKLKQVLMIIVLLCASLRSLRYLFRKRLGQFANSEKDVDIVCDTEVWSFTDGTARLIMPFMIENFDFLTDPKKEMQRPNLEGVADEQTAAILCAFRRLFARGGTNDTRIWKKILAKHRENPQIKEMLKSGYMSEFVLQISDGAILGTDDSIVVLEEFRQEYAAATGGLAVGDNESEAEGAKEALEKRHDVVITANNPLTIADNFSEFLKRMVHEQVEKPMLEIIENL